MDVSLVMFKADKTRREFPVLSKKFVVGRKNTCDLRIPLTSVSRMHCELRIEDGQIKLRDLGSSNGTYHNNTRVQEAVLLAGDELVIGPVVFTVVVDGKPSKIEPVHSLTQSPQGLDDSASLPSGLIEELGAGPSGSGDSGADTISDHQAGDQEEDPLAALDRLAELEIPEGEGQV